MPNEPQIESYEVEVPVSSFFDSVRKGVVYDVMLEIQHGMNVNTRDGRGRTAGHIAVYNGNDRMLKMLLEKGLNLEIKDEDGRTVPDIVRDFCVGRSKIKMQKLLDDHSQKLAAQARMPEEDLGTAEVSAGGVKTLQTTLRDGQLLASEKKDKRVSTTSDSDSSAASAKSTDSLHHGNSSIGSIPVSAEEITDAVTQQQDSASSPSPNS